MFLCSAYYCSPKGKIKLFVTSKENEKTALLVNLYLLYFVAANTYFHPAVIVLLRFYLVGKVANNFYVIPVYQYFYFLLEKHNL
jgi:hypothetical protein